MEAEDSTDSKQVEKDSASRRGGIGLILIAVVER
jgi:hypothetical protein